MTQRKIALSIEEPYCPNPAAWRKHTALRTKACQNTGNLQAGEK